MGDQGTDADDPPGLREAGEDPALTDQGLLRRAPAKNIGAAARAGGPEPVPSYRGPVEPPADGKTGICCSGGGIRSAAFNLGALQALHEADELPNAEYLAAVSGGSYICAAYSMVGTHWKEDSPPKKKGDVGWDCSDPELLDKQRVFGRGSPEEQYLRNRSSYMAPDVWTKLYLGIRILLGLLFNVFFLMLPVFGLAVLAGMWLYAPRIQELRGNCSADSCTFHPSLAAWIVPLVVAGLALFVAFIRVLRTAPTERSRKFSEGWSTRLLVGAAGLAVLLLVLPALADVVQGKQNHATAAHNATQTGATGATGLVGLVVGVLAALREAVATPKKAIETAGRARKRLVTLGSRVRRLLVYLAATLAGPLLILAVAVFGLTVAFHSYQTMIHPIWIVGVGLGAIALFGGLYALTDITSLSLHPFYRRRLCTAFALKRVKPELVNVDRARAAVPQEREQGVALERDYELFVRLSETALDHWPALIVCAAANISDKRVTPPGRPVTSFTFSANAVGGPLVGGMRTRDYEKAFSSSRDSGRIRDFTLPAAVAMSGAAVSPSMGKMTPRAFTFLLTLANIRLGVWLPNPRWVARLKAEGKESQRKWYGRARPSYLFRELIGHNSIDAKYLYVSDGGHYENLGLVELLRRGCTRVFCLDASGGSVGGELGDAVALARSELDVKVDLDPTPLTPEGDPPTAKQDTVTGTLTYRDGTKGTIVYARNVISPGEPWDIRAHQLKDPRFPHDSTLDQLYTDQKFESYRALGAEAGAHAAERMAELAPRDEGDDDALPPAQVKHLVDTGSIQLVDIREQFAYDTVRIDGAIHIEPTALTQVPLQQDYPIVFLCGDGRRSREVAAAFRQISWDASSLAGGMARWVDDGFPVASAPADAGASNGTPA
jgi:rhodanese-related sulfurtransferase/uncharacterized BrkB/YihY/UPF0761 family membrane protein